MKLEITSADLIIENGKLCTVQPVKYEQIDNKIKIYGKQINFNFINYYGAGHQTQINYGGNNTYNGNIYSNVGIIGDNITITGGTVGNIITNGKIIDPEIIDNDEDSYQKLNFDLDQDISEIKLTGDCNVKLYSNIGKRFNVTIFGNGIVNLYNCTINLANLVISGFGSISGRNCNINTINAQISGSGDINNLHVNTGILNVSGAGNISIISPHPNMIIKNVSGTGRIRINSFFF